MSEVTFILAFLVFIFGHFVDKINWPNDAPEKIEVYAFGLWLLGVSISIQLNQIIKKIKSRS